MRVKLSFISKALLEAQDVHNQFFQNESKMKTLESAVSAMAEAMESGNKVLSCGNGGSLCDAMHFAEELTGRFRKDRKALPAMSLVDPSHMSCVANDFGYDHVFSRMVEAFGKDQDVLLAISTSGNSKNVILAAEAAKNRNMTVVGLLGKGGGELKDLVDFPIIVDGTKCTDRIQEMHIKFFHIFIEGIERKLFPEHYE